MLPHKDQIQAIFLSSFKDENIGALPFLLKQIKVPVYATELTIHQIKQVLEDTPDLDAMEIEFREIKKGTKASFKDCTFSFYFTSSALPESVGIIAQTELGKIIYTGSFSLNKTPHPLYQTEFSALMEAALAKDTLALLPDCSGVSQFTTSYTQDKYQAFLTTVFKNTEGRLFFAVADTDIKRIQEIITWAERLDRKICFSSRKSFMKLLPLIKKGYLSLDLKSLVSQKHVYENGIQNVVMIITGNLNIPLIKLQSIAKSKNPRQTLSKTDAVCILMKPIPGVETMFAATLDELFKTECKTYYKPNLIVHDLASSTDISFMLSLLSPRYIIPLRGEYSQQVKLKETLITFGFSEKNILIMENGDIAHFNKKSGFVSKKELPAADKLIDEVPIDENNDIIVKERAYLAEDGIFILAFRYSFQDRKVHGDFNIFSKGFSRDKDFISEITEIANTFLVNFHAKLGERGLQLNDLKKQLRQHIANFIYTKKRKNPIVNAIISVIR